MVPRVTVYIDSREHKLWEHFQFLYSHIESIKVERKRLSIGDVAITFDDTIVSIIERKTVTDFMGTLANLQRFHTLLNPFLLKKKIGCDTTLIIEQDEIPYNKHYLINKNIVDRCFTSSEIDDIIARNFDNTIPTNSLINTLKFIIDYAINLSETLIFCTVKGNNRYVLFDKIESITSDVTKYEISYIK